MFDFISLYFVCVLVNEPYKSRSSEGLLTEVLIGRALALALAVAVCYRSSMLQELYAAGAVCFC